MLKFITEHHDDFVIKRRKLIRIKQNDLRIV